MSGNAGVPIPEGPSGLLLSRDLIFTSKVTGTAQAMGHRVVVAGNAASAAANLGAWAPAVVFVDLGAGDLVGPEAIAEFRAIAPPGTPFLAFGSHVDTGALAAARDSGCDPVLPRSRFTAELPALIRRYFGDD